METNTHTHLPLSWEAPAHVEHTRSKRWYIIAGTIGLSFIVYGILSHSWPMTIAFIAAIAVYTLFHNQPYHQYNIRITSEGISIDGEMQAWDQWNSFWILVDADTSELHMAKKNSKKDFRVFLAKDIKPEDVRDVLVEFVPQDTTKKENLFDYIIRFCKI